MELSKLILKIMYLVVLYALCYFVIRSKSNADNMNIILLSLFISVILLYFTFDNVYQYLINSQLVFKVTSDDSTNDDSTTNDSTTDDSSGNTDSSTSATSSSASSSSSISDYVMNHTHNFIQNGVFDNV
jgi:hypothetical protein